MSLRQRLDSDLKDAMRKKDAVRRTVLRTILSEIRNAEIASRNELDDLGIQNVMTKQAQQRRDSIEAYDSAGRNDLVQKESAELSIISGYLPEQMSEDEVNIVISEVLDQVNAQGLSDMGKVMGTLMPKIRGRADGKLVNSIVSARLKEL